MKLDATNVEPPHRECVERSYRSRNAIDTKLFVSLIIFRQWIAPRAHHKSNMRRATDNDVVRFVEISESPALLENYLSMLDANLASGHKLSDRHGLGR